MTQEAKWREKIQNQNWSETVLDKYLLYDKWDELSAWRVLAGFHFSRDPESIGFMLLDSKNELDLKIKDRRNIQTVLELDHYYLKRFSENSDQEREYDTPRAYIDWALSKRFKPLWLDWAIEHKLYEPKQEASQNMTGTITPATTYSTKWLEIQQAAIQEFFSPRHEVDAKRDAVISWIETKAEELKITAPNRIATSIFTIIKPEDHSPRKRRVAPLKDQ